MHILKYKKNTLKFNVNTLTKLSNDFCPLFSITFHKRKAKMDKKKYLRQNPA